MRFVERIVLNSGGRLNGCNEGHDRRPKSTDKRADEVMALKKQGMDLRAISRELKMPVSPVHKALQMAA
jgi:hypothetical protein